MSNPVDENKQVNNDLAAFLATSRTFSDMANAMKYQMELQDMFERINSRTMLYLEMMGAAFLQETGLKASEVELIQGHTSDIKTGDDIITWRYVKRGSNE